MESLRPRGRLGISLLATLLIAALAAPPVGAEDIAESKGFRKAVTLAGIREHQAALQAIADANDDTRSSGTPGYEDSAQYVYERLADAGYDPVLQPFDFPFFEQLAPSTFERVSPDPVVYTEGASADYALMTYSGSGDVTAGVSHVVDQGGALPGAGCEAGDFAGFTVGNIALIQRGSCTFKIKAVNAEAAGASGVVVYNNGPGALNGTLGTPGQNIPVIGTLQSIGQGTVALLGGGPVVFHLAASTESEVRTTWNVIAETATGDPDRVVVVGAHLDSRLEGPGIQDNGSGSATILEIAETFAAQDRTARNQLRFMWYGAEEFNLLGSSYYVANLDQDEIDSIMAMVNFDMVGSPNFVRFVYDGDNSSFPVGPGAAEGPPGSAYIEDLFIDYFNSQGLANDPTPFSGRSDYGPFIAVGIPAGGLFTGAEGIKTAEQAATYGGTAGIAYDPCYHQACDTYDNVSTTGLDQMSDAAAHVVLTLSRVKVDVRQTEATAALRTSGSLVARDFHVDAALAAR
jgi:Zn-dependent M28 family amino/carboxypeptidase